MDLKDRMGFSGWVISDWGATHSTARAARAGLDQEVGREGRTPCTRQAARGGPPPVRYLALEWMVVWLAAGP